MAQSAWKNRQLSHSPDDGSDWHLDLQLSLQEVPQSFMQASHSVPAAAASCVFTASSTKQTATATTTTLEAIVW
jgi:hypothetical protein